MFKLILKRESTCMVLDTDDFSVDSVSPSFCVDMLTKGYQIEGIFKAGSNYAFKPVLGVLPNSGAVKNPVLRKCLLTLQLQGFNIGNYKVGTLKKNATIIGYTNRDYKILTKLKYLHPRVSHVGVASKSLDLTESSAVEVRGIHLGQGETVPVTGFEVVDANDKVLEVFLVFE